MAVTMMHSVSGLTLLMISRSCTPVIQGIVMSMSATAIALALLYGRCRNAGIALQPGHPEFPH